MACFGYAVIKRDAVETRVVADPFDHDVEDWIDRLEREFTAVDPEHSSAGRDAEALKGRAARRSSRQVRPARDPRESVQASRPTPEPPASGIEQRLTEQMDMLSSAHRELARTESLLELMKEVAVEIRMLREEVAATRESSVEIRSLRREMDQVKAVLALLRELTKAVKPSG